MSQLTASYTNAIFTVKDNKLIIEIDLTKEFGLSGSGKSTTVATTSGNVPVPGHENIKVGLNVYKPVRK